MSYIACFLLFCYICYMFPFNIKDIYLSLLLLSNPFQAQTFSFIYDILHVPQG